MKRKNQVFCQLVCHVHVFFLLKLAFDDRTLLILYPASATSFSLSSTQKNIQVVFVVVVRTHRRAIRTYHPVINLGRVCACFSQTLQNESCKNCGAIERNKREKTSKAKKKDKTAISFSSFLMPRFLLSPSPTCSFTALPYKTRHIIFLPLLLLLVRWACVFPRLFLTA